MRYQGAAVYKVKGEIPMNDYMDSDVLDRIVKRLPGCPADVAEEIMMVFYARYLKSDGDLLEALDRFLLDLFPKNYQE